MLVSIKLCWEQISVVEREQGCNGPIRNIWEDYLIVFWSGPLREKTWLKCKYVASSDANIGSMLLRHSRAQSGLKLYVCCTEFDPTLMMYVDACDEYLAYAMLVHCAYMCAKQCQVWYVAIEATHGSEWLIAHAVLVCYIACHAMFDPPWCCILAFKCIHYTIFDCCNGYWIMAMPSLGLDCLKTLVLAICCTQIAK